jgi:hypothetical protein
VEGCTDVQMSMVDIACLYSMHVQHVCILLVEIGYGVEFGVIW